MIRLHCCGELGIGQVVVPIILLIRHIVSEHLFKCSVHSLSLSIGLRVKGSGHSDLGSKSLEECLPEVTCEFGVAVTDNYSGKSILTEDRLEEDSSDLRGSGIGCGWLGDCDLGQAVHKHDDGIIA